MLRGLVAFGVFAVLIFFFSPSWGAFRLAARVPELRSMLEVRRGASVLEQVDHPGTEIADPLHRIIQWRLLFPLIGHFLGLSPGPFFALAPLGCFFVLAWILTILRRSGVDWIDSFLAAITLGATSWFFTSCGWLGYFDAWLALGLLIVAFANARWAIWFACVWAPWVDERFVIAVPLALLCRFLLRGKVGTHVTVAFNPLRDAGVPMLLLVGFVVIRLGGLSSHSAAGATVSGYFAGRKPFDAPVFRLLFGIWEGLRMSWVFVVGAAIILFKRYGALRAILLGAVVVGIAGIGLGTAQDYSRAMTMLLPAALLGVVVAAETGASWLSCALRVSASAALLLPAHHVMSDRVNPIYYLYHELAVLEVPPPIAMPEIYELHAIHEMESGDFVQAEADLSLAIKLSTNPASPLKQRGILAASQGRWPDAYRDFSLLVEWDAQNPDAWFMRAQAGLALRNIPAAQADFDRARGLARSDWTTRPDVARFLINLNRSAGAK